MHRHFSQGAMLLVLFAALGACGKSNAGDSAAESIPTDGLHEQIDDFNDLALEKRAEIERALEQQLDSAREELADIATLAKQHGAQGRAKLVEELRREEQLARAKFEELRGSSAEQWQRLCRETQTESRRLAEQAKALFQDG